VSLLSLDPRSASLHTCSLFGHYRNEVYEHKQNKTFNLLLKYGLFRIYRLSFLRIWEPISTNTVTNTVILLIAVKKVCKVLSQK
jgi:hypothetical protein